MHEVGWGGTWLNQGVHPSPLHQKKKKTLLPSIVFHSLPHLHAHLLPHLRMRHLPNHPLLYPDVNFYPATYGQGEKGKRKKLFRKIEDICRVDRRELEKNLSTRKRALLGLLFKISSIDGKSVEDPNNFPRPPGVTTLIRDTSKYINVWVHLFEAREAYPGIRMVELDSPDLIKLHNFCTGRVPLRLHPSLHRALKLTYPTDVGGIVLDGRMTTELGTGSLGQSVGFLQISGPYVNRLIVIFFIPQI